MSMCRPRAQEMGYNDKGRGFNINSIDRVLDILGIKLVHALTCIAGGNDTASFFMARNMLKESRAQVLEQEDSNEG